MGKYVYFFGNGKADGTGDMKDLLGGKGAGLAEMTNAQIPVPPGFTITTEVCRLYYENNSTLTQRIKWEIDEALKKLEDLLGASLGDEKSPLLLSVRSGAKFSMPGMMDTILNLGLNDKTVEGLAKRTSNRRFAYDSYRRFIQMFGNVVLGIDKDVFEHILNKKKEAKKVKLDIDLKAEDWEDIVKEYKKAIKRVAGINFPQNCKVQLQMAIEAVFKSWNNPRAITYRKLNNIPSDLGTAVNVQSMVFGNMGNKSATGVGFTRNPATGEKTFYGEFLVNAQGEDVVAGIRTPQPIEKLKKIMPNVYKELKQITDRLEKHYRDVQDFEFTIQEGNLYMLQTRVGKRTGLAAVKIAVDMVEEGLITKEEAVSRVEPSALEQLLHPVFDPAKRQKAKSQAKGLPASPGAAAGQIVFTAEEAVEWTKKGKKVVLVRLETVPDDIHGMHVAEGVLTATGGMTSHAAVVGRQMGKPSVVGCGDLQINTKTGKLTIKGKSAKRGDYISIDGSTGDVFLEKIPTVPSDIIRVITGKMKPSRSKIYKYFDTLLSWADEIKRLGIRANADTPTDSRIARAFGAKGIGLCRTEHMFFEGNRIPTVVKMILSAKEGQKGIDIIRGLEAQLKEASGDRKKEIKEQIKAVEKEYRSAIKDYTGALDKLRELQRKDFYDIFKEMEGLPVTIRTLDPPLHEFLPKREELLVEIATLKAKGAKKNAKKIEEKESLLKQVEELHEFNPMLGHRGCRLGITYPEITRMQANAIFSAACDLAKKNKTVVPEIMIPLVGDVAELKAQKEIVVDEAQKVIKEKKTKINYLVGTMIELPRGALTADEIAEDAQFFSFGTNDLTQTTFGFSRDDCGKFLKIYLEMGIREKDPFQTIDRNGVGQLVKIGVEKGRSTRSSLKVGVCGEHGGDPDSIDFFNGVGLDYVSCSPFRVPVARLSAAQAVIREKSKE
ncbi:MAG: pyruvate, phosphate dikinase [Candidatus Schekmanbacteria bacterium]|nr:MAG: pyruvate, phosphate dikinase [Candidatus Schekmanbacteria bacterium]